jgi:hypothetical protein
MAGEVGARALADPVLGADAIAHARMFVDRPDFDLASATAPTFALAPDGAMHEALARDYRLMAAMIFGEIPPFETVLESVFDLDRRLNAAAASPIA